MFVLLCGPEICDDYGMTKSRSGYQISFLIVCIKFLSSVVKIRHIEKNMGKFLKLLIIRYDSPEDKSCH